MDGVAAPQMNGDGDVHWVSDGGWKAICFSLLSPSTAQRIVPVVYPQFTHKHDDFMDRREIAHPHPSLSLL